MTALGPIVGSGGVVSVLVAWVGYKTQASRGRPEIQAAAGTKVGADISAWPIKASDIVLLAEAATQLSGSINRNNLIMEYQIEKRGDHDRFEEWAERKEMRAALDAMKQERAAAR